MALELDLKKRGHFDKQNWEEGVSDRGNGVRGDSETTSGQGVSGLS